jgi:hypothetical protein
MREVLKENGMATVTPDPKKKKLQFTSSR